MYKNKANNRNNIIGIKLREYRITVMKISQQKLAVLFQLNGLDIDKNAVQRIESGARFVTDIELRIFVKTMNVSYEYLIDENT